MKTTLLFLSVFLSASLFGQNVYIPDANFKAVLVGNTFINTNGDTEIQVSEASTFYGTIGCQFMNISDLTGIEAFTALPYLNCSFNELTSLDVSNNTALENLWCDDNQLISLDVSGATALTYLDCSVNQLESLDVSSNTALTVLNCESNLLECLNIKNGNNTLVGGGEFYAYNNPSLTCIEVDDVTYSTANWTDIDSQVSFSIDCNSSTDIITECDSYTWLDGNTYTASNNTATYNIPNAAGCDSIITLDLTINNSSSSTDVMTACNSYMGPDGEVWTSSGYYPIALLVNSVGCDSVIGIDLTIISTPEPTIIQNGSTLACTNFASGYQWLDCDANYNPIIGETGMTFTSTQSGNYALEISFNGCSDTSECFSIDLSGIGELSNIPKQLIKIVDVLGRETPFKPNTPILYIYNDGTVERKMIIK